MKKIISIILCLAMVFAMAATAFAATSGVNFSVKKTDEDGNALAGAEFELTDGRVTYPSEVSNPEGVAWFYGVEPGNYTLKETAAPGGYKKSDDTYEIIVNADGRIEVVVDGDPMDYDFENEPIIFVNEKEKFNFAPMNPSKDILDDILDDIIDIFDDDEPETPEVKEPEEVEEANPNTGAPVFAVPAVIAVLCGAALLGKRK